MPSFLSWGLTPLSLRITTLGRIDVLITTESEAWVIEIKVDQSVEKSHRTDKDQKILRQVYQYR